MTAHELDNRHLVSFLALSVALHAVALLAPRMERTPPPLPENPALVFEVVEPAPVTAAPKAVEPPPPPPPPKETPPPRPEPVAKVAPKVAPAPPKTPTSKPVPAPTPAAVAKPSPPAPPSPPVARASVAAPAVRARYEDVLYSWLVRHKEYPLVARRRGIEGKPVVTVRIDRGGRVISSQVSSPSRYAMLDEAAIAMVRRADPFPAPPAEIGGDSYEFVAPVEYRLQ